MSPNMKVLKTVKPVSVKKHGDGFIVDMGQNMAGWLKLRIGGVNAGDTVSIIFSENINPDGSLNRANFRHALSTDKYVANGNENGRWWSPTFVYHGFRYVEIKGMGNVTADGLIGEVISDEMAETGTFTSSDTILNKVYNNAVWGILANYKGMPVDCPQRDERHDFGYRRRGRKGRVELQVGWRYVDGPVNRCKYSRNPRVDHTQLSSTGGYSANVPGNGKGERSCRRLNMGAFPRHADRAVRAGS